MAVQKLFHIRAFVCQITHELGECLDDEMVANHDKKYDKFGETRSTLLVRLKDLEDQEAWYDFFETYWRLIFNFARKAGLSERDAEDVVQETVRSVARRMPEFEYNRKRGSFRSWLLTLTRRRVVDHRRYAERRGGRETIGVEPEELAGHSGDVPSDLEQLWADEWQQWLVSMALERVKQQVSARQYQIFYACAIREWEMAAVMETFDASRDQVYQARHRVGKLFDAAVKELEEQN